MTLFNQLKERYEEGKTLPQEFYTDEEIFSDEMKKISSISNSDEFNVYSLVWTKEKIYWLLNNNVTYEHKNMDVMPFDNNHYLTLEISRF